MSASVISVLRSLGTGEIAPPPAAAWSSSAPQIVSEQCTRADDNNLPFNGPSSSPEDAFIFPSLVGEVEDCELLHTLSTVLGRVLNSVISSEEQEEAEDSAEARLSPFHGHRVPHISMRDYVMRISKYSKCSNVCAVMAYSYLQRLAKKEGRFMLCPCNIHRMYLAGIMLAAKLMDDNVFNSPYWAKIGGISTEELHELELYALKQLDYRLIVSPNEVATRLRELKVLAHSRAATPGEAGLFIPADQQPALMA